MGPRQVPRAVTVAQSRGDSVGTPQGVLIGSKGWGACTNAHVRHWVTPQMTDSGDSQLPRDRWREYQQPEGDHGEVLGEKTTSRPG